MNPDSVETSTPFEVTATSIGDLSTAAVAGEDGGGGGGDPLVVSAAMTALYVAILAAGLVGNVSTCAVIARTRHLHTATNYYLFSLAVSDLLLLVSGLPHELYNMWVQPYALGQAVCVLQGFAAETSANASVLTITAFTVERYVAICHPFQARGLSQLSRAVKLVVAVWCVALCLAVPQAIQFGVVDSPDSRCSVKQQVMENAFHVSTGVFFVLPMSVITVLYVLIGLRLRSPRAPSASASSASCGGGCVSVAGSCRGSAATLKRPSIDSARQPVSLAANQKYVIRMLVAVVVAFFICWAPFHAQRLLAVYAYSSESLRSSATFVTVYQVLTHISGVFYFLGTAINPLLYHIMSHKFRQAFKETLSELCGWRRRKRHPRRAYSSVSPGHKASARSLPHQCYQLHHHHQHPAAAAAAPRPAGRRADACGEQLALLQRATPPRAASNDSQATLTTSLSRISVGADDTPAADRRLDANGCCRHKLDLISEHYSNERTSDGNATAAADERSVSSLAKKIRDGLFKREAAAPATPANASEQQQPPRLRHADSLHLSVDSAKSTISNSSLQDMDEMEFDSSELAHYMGELNEQGLAR